MRAYAHIVNESDPLEDRLHAEAPLAIQTFDGVTWLAFPPAAAFRLSSFSSSPPTVFLSWHAFHFH